MPLFGGLSDLLKTVQLLIQACGNSMEHQFCSHIVVVVVYHLQVDNLSKEWAAHADLPQHVVQMLNNFPETLHPMSQFSAAITAMNSESKFAKAYAQGVHKNTYWEVRVDARKVTFFLI